MEELERIVTIVSYEEFSDMTIRTGNDELTTIELMEAIAEISAIIYQYQYTDIWGIRSEERN
jgi:hypothetical protein|tara:strand:- start:1675 stop:1860 length:186 start_codon:yes stop_codon:yes gene_type:complete